MTDLEINKFCFSLITGGKGVWHEGESVDHLVCVCGVVYCKARNPDYLENKEDAYDLIQFVVNEWDDKEYEDFVSSIQQDEPYYNEYSFPRHLLRDTRALPTALAEHEKGKE